MSFNSYDTNHYVPNLVVPGFPKSGTSSLFYYLSQHPEICGAIAKEPHIYTFDKRYDRRFDHTEKLSYPNLFNQCPLSSRYFLEASTTYLISPNALERIYKDNPACKILIIARDPIERLVSHYNWLFSLELVQKPFRKEIAEWIGKEFDPENHFHGNYKNYIEFSKYGEQLERCFSLFPKENVHFLTTEELRDYPEETMNKVYSFLSLCYEVTDYSTRKNSTKIRGEKNMTPTWLIKAGKIFPSNFRRYINQRYIAPVFVKKQKVPRITNSDKKWIYNHLAQDLLSLKKLGISFEHWKTTSRLHNAGKAN